MQGQRHELGLALLDFGLLPFKFNSVQIVKINCCSFTFEMINSFPNTIEVIYEKLFFINPCGLSNMRE